jgi:hypothetical protein
MQPGTCPSRPLWVSLSLLWLTPAGGVHLTAAAGRRGSSNRCRCATRRCAHRMAGTVCSHVPQLIPATTQGSGCVRRSGNGASAGGCAPGITHDGQRASIQYDVRRRLDERALLPLSPTCRCPAPNFSSTQRAASRQPRHSARPPARAHSPLIDAPHTTATGAGAHARRPQHTPHRGATAPRILSERLQPRRLADRRRPCIFGHAPRGRASATPPPRPEAVAGMPPRSTDHAGLARARRVSTLIAAGTCR